MGVQVARSHDDLGFLKFPLDKPLTFGYNTHMKNNMMNSPLDTVFTLSVSLARYELDALVLDSIHRTLESAEERMVHLLDSGRVGSSEELEIKEEEVCA